ncbi:MULTISPECIES: RNA ligase family protein [unclassified Nostoc]|uniref:RNA ligase family protein n=1 Tax=unclassified Nostoc TaxID=2593658 RepID=UPI002AD3602B|nr:RNA ligase family protein [Nostoc sp. DedQUE03]MDZ7976458.1 RNA ligase family protein [Nostoc sp. DedQUE03]MDZ8042781.1 RNA ligase family protein [Nostoc sp. DedQUE02]
MNYNFSVRSCDLNKLNSMTKYPSIPTYHALDNKGKLLDEVVSFNGEVILTEKIDGTNSRIIMLPDGNYILGSREELLFAKGDLIGNPALGIVDALRSVADQLPHSEHKIIVAYLELYGGKVTAGSKQYTAKQSIAWRLFDVAVNSDITMLFTKSVQQLASWRDNGGQTFLDEDQLRKASIDFGFELTPRLATVEALPVSIEETYEFLKALLPKTLLALDEGAGGRGEGIVARTFSRSMIAKIRFEDYERHTKHRQ